MFSALKTAIRAFRNGKPTTTYSMVLLMRRPFAQTREHYCEAAEHAFGVAYDGTNDMHFVEQTKDFFFVKAGELLFSIIPHWGPYLSINGEDDVETGAALVPPEQARWWKMQRAWAAVDLRNEDMVEADAMRVLAKLMLELVDERCCGVWLPNTGLFLPNDGTAINQLRRYSLGQDSL